MNIEGDGETTKYIKVTLKDPENFVSSKKSSTTFMIDPKNYKELSRQAKNSLFRYGSNNRYISHEDLTQDFFITLASRKDYDMNYIGEDGSQVEIDDFIRASFKADLKGANRKQYNESKNFVSNVSETEDSEKVDIFDTIPSIDKIQISQSEAEKEAEELTEDLKYYSDSLRWSIREITLFMYFVSIIQDNQDVKRIKLETLNNLGFNIDDKEYREITKELESFENLNIENIYNVFKNKAYFHNRDLRIIKFIVENSIYELNMAELYTKKYKNVIELHKFELDIDRVLSETRDKYERNKESIKKIAFSSKKAFNENKNAMKVDININKFMNYMLDNVCFDADIDKNCSVLERTVELNRLEIYRYKVFDFRHGRIFFGYFNKDNERIDLSCIPQIHMFIKDSARLSLEKVRRIMQLYATACEIGDENLCSTVEKYVEDRDNVSYEEAMQIFDAINDGETYDSIEELRIGSSAFNKGHAVTSYTGQRMLPNIKYKEMIDLDMNNISNYVSEMVKEMYYSDKDNIYITDCKKSEPVTVILNMLGMKINISIDAQPIEKCNYCASEEDEEEE